uniref:SWIM-type domain-containing protein n=1 Tax=Arundo donax TaxID=35708 RepID=A0A0A9DKB0_ARUDO
MRSAADGSKRNMFLPSVGQTFPSINDAYQFYNLYSWEFGFSIRCCKSNDRSVNGTKQRIMQEWSCQRGGQPKKGTVHSTTMCGCPARLRVIRNSKGEYYVSIFVADHNHELVESCGEKRHLHSHQSIDQATKNMVRYLRENNVSLSKVRCILGSINGSMGNLTFSKQRLKTVCADIASDLISDDMQKTFQSFIEMHDVDPNFVYSFQLDSECRVTALMWSSGYSCRMYSHFGDVVTFDTTYRTNLYNMPFGMFVGVNNHFQSVIYAGVLMVSEETSFEWAFKTFVKMMGGKAPVTMLTDQCAAMGAAIRNVLKQTVHRWCKWHVFKKVVEVLGHLFNSKGSFQDDFNKVVNHMLSKKEFKDSWQAMLEKYGLQGHPELNRAFEARKMWAKAWFKNVFCAKMTSTQRSESANNVLKNLVPCNSPLNLFVQQYAKLVKEQEMADHQEEKKTKQRVIKLRFGWRIEGHAATLYTRAAYELFLEELHKSTAYILEDTDKPLIYKVVHIEKERREKWSKVEFYVSVDEKTSFHSCECALYNHFGIPCCHTLLVMYQKGVTEIPAVHIMKRWTRAARDNVVDHLLPVQDTSGPMNSKIFRHNVLENTAKEVISLAELDPEGFDYALKQLLSVQKNLQARRNSLRTSCHVGFESSDSEFEASSSRNAFSDSDRPPLQIVDTTSGVAIDVNAIQAPIVRKAHGRPSNKRWKSAREVSIRTVKIRKERSRKQAAGGSGAVKQTRHCKKCRSRFHDIRQCPEMQPLSPIEDEEDEMDL